METAEPGPGRAAGAPTEKHEPFHARSRGGLAAAEQDGAHVRGRGRRRHAGGVLRRRAPLSALLPDYWTWRISSSGSCIRPD